MMLQMVTNEAKHGRNLGAAKQRNRCERIYMVRWRGYMIVMLQSGEVLHCGSGT